MLVDVGVHAQDRAAARDQVAEEQRGQRGVVLPLPPLPTRAIFNDVPSMLIELRAWTLLTTVITVVQG